MPEYCTRCGVANKETAEFCISCGESMKTEKQKKVDEKKESSQTSEKKLYRSRTDKMITGLSAGIAKYADMEVDLVRILWIVGLFVSGGIVAVVYLIMAAVIPLEPE
jgi:phage shock protein PspC (stress-responsive transcriptional regulator)